MDRGALGRAGEEAAARFLVRDGWTLLDRNARVRAGELDLVLERDGVLAFVEVKARRTHRAGSPAEAVDERRAGRVARAAAEYLARKGLPEAPRTFLVAAVEMDGEGRAVRVGILPMNG